MSKMALVAMGFLALTGWGCESEDEGDEEPVRLGAAPPGTEPGPQSDVPLGEQMHDSFVRTVDARDAVIGGDLQAAQEAGRLIAAVEPSADLPPAWRPFATRMRERAAALADAGNLDQAALEVGALGTACGDCHAALNAGVTFTAQSPPAGDDVTSHMLRHQWATDRMWEGLVAPDAARFDAGASALVGARLHPHALAPDRSVPEAVAQLATRAHELAENAAQATDPAMHGQLYAELLATCNTCHAELTATRTPPPSD